MSSLSASLCLFSAALCNVAVLDQSLFGQQQGNQQQQQLSGQNLFGTATNLFNAGLGALTGTGGGGRPQGQGNRPRPPHQTPCAGKFQYVTNGREWKGIIKLKNVNPNVDTRLEAEFVLPQGMQRRVRSASDTPSNCRAKQNSFSFSELPSKNRDRQRRHSLR